jgi:sentrin-specific protease 8
MDERVVLSRGDTCLREADVALLRGQNWLNDQLVSFYFAHLSESQPDESVLLLGGSVTFFLANCEEEDAAVVTGPLHADSRTLILCALNDNESVSTANGGSHWTLLALRRSATQGGDVSFLHYDSLAQSRNSAVARRVAQTLAAALRLPSGSARVEAARVPQQANSYDCGLHALLTAQKLYEAHHTSPGRALSQAELAAAVTPAAASKLRGDMVELIARYAAEETDKPWDD